MNAEDKAVNERLERLATMDAAGKAAAANPLPGPLAEVFSPTPDIEVGKWKVRRFVDRDFEFLKALDHPLSKMMAAGMNGQPVGEDYAPRGPMAWELAWIMTRPVKEVKARFLLGPSSVRDAADDEFGDCSLQELAALSDAVFKQMSVYWSPVVGYGPAAQKPEEGQGEAKPERPFPSTGGLTTGSGG